MKYNRFSLAGRLSGHQAPVMALALNCDGEHNMVISGSKDHYIKVCTKYALNSTLFHLIAYMMRPHLKF